MKGLRLLLFAAVLGLLGTRMVLGQLYPYPRPELDVETRDDTPAVVRASNVQYLAGELWYVCFCGTYGSARAVLVARARQPGSPFADDGLLQLSSGLLGPPGQTTLLFRLLVS